MAKWEEFEKLTAKILQELCQHAIVKHNDFIDGILSKTKRQIDVSIRSTVDGADILTIVQSKDISAPADINVVGEFASVIQDVRATKGILVCRNGFTVAAKIYAKNLGIVLLNMHDAESRDWNLDIKLPIIWKEYVISTEVIVGMDMPREGELILFKEENRPSGFSGIMPRFTKDDGTQLIDPLNTIKRLWNEEKLPKIPDKKFRIKVPDQLKILVRIDNLDQWLKVDSCQLLYEIKPNRILLGFYKPNECRGILNYSNNDEFIVSHLPNLGEIPIKPEEDWQEISHPSKLPIEIKGTVLSVIAIANLEYSPDSELQIDGEMINI